MPNELHTMPVKVEAILSSTAAIEMSNEQFGAYCKLLFHSWLNGGGIFVTDLLITKYCGVVNPDELERIKPILKKWFTVQLEDGKMANSTLLEVYAKTMEKSNRRSLAGKKAMEKRWSRKKDLLSVCYKQNDNNQNQNQNQNIYNTPKPPRGDVVIPVPECLKQVDAFKKTWAEWVEYRKKLGKCKDWPKMFKRQLEFLEAHKDFAVDILKRSMLNGWTGLFEIKANPAQPKSTYHEPTPEDF